MKLWVMLSTAVAVGLASPAIAQHWSEQGDAGDLPGTAQVPTGAGALNSIAGVISDDFDADMYCIHIDGNFSASLCGGAAFDTQLFLFSRDGTGVSFRDDSCDLQSTLGDIQPAPGDYFIAISGFDRDALNAGGSEIWSDTPYGLERAPDGPGAPGPIAAWGGAGDSGEYVIALAGVSYCGQATPVEPKTWGGIKAIYR